MVRDNLINNCPVALESIKVAYAIFGPDATSLQEKMVWRRLEHVDHSYVETPPEIISCNLNTVVVADLVFVNGLPFLVLIIPL